MSKPVVRPSAHAVLCRLKDFQRDTVDYVFQRLYADHDPVRRFLIADEVGLGKTLVARGLIARAVEHLWDSVPRIDVVYVCSNADIARQNIDRLRIGDQQDFALPSRITLLPTKVKELQKNKLNFISFTPGTSFDLKSSLGTVEERALLYWLLRDAWSLSHKGELNVLQGSVRSSASFLRSLQYVHNTQKIDESLKVDFITRLEQRIAEERRVGEKDLRSRFNDLSRRFSHKKNVLPTDVASERADVIGEMRALLAATCLKALEPDLIILDEFQRFKHLLEGKDDASRLARDLFEFGESRVLLLSATPYKMYTLADESNTDDHYLDFVRTMRFLQNDTVQTKRFERLLHDYRLEILRLADGAHDRLLELKKDIESRMRRVMVRTERLAVAEDRDGMLRNVPTSSTKLLPADLRDYAAVQCVARALGVEDSLEYWKSSPYLLNFMQDYQLKRRFDGCPPAQRAELLEVLAGSLLDWQKISTYRQIDPGNARLRELMADMVDSGAWQLLWVPPSLPYYQPAGPYATLALRRFTKRLVFSSWNVVPRAIASLLSYEVERRIFKSFDESLENQPDAAHRRSRLLQFARSEGRLTGMPLIGLIYPSVTLAGLCDPLHLSSSQMQWESDLPTLKDVIQVAEARIAELLSKVRVNCAEGSTEDESWYWAAPILIDQAFDSSSTVDWLTRQAMANVWNQGRQADDEGAESHFAEHVQRAQRLLASGQALGPQPRDLVHVLALQAVAGPGNAALRALARVIGSDRALEIREVRDRAAQLGLAFLHLFNLPEASALIRSRDRREPYWLRVLEYCADGNLQATLDEYAHVLRDSLGLFDAKSERKSAGIAEAMRNALTLRTATLRVDDFDCSAARSESTRGHGMRARFALRFGDERVDGSSDSNRSDLARSSFNSPFWPFVLATTSVGQEGLDFHHYCHAVVHWNLPSNPVDLEQREGRVHRYKGHAVRRNLALCHGRSVLAAPNGDPWEGLFQRASSERRPDDNDLVPYWVFHSRNEEGATIERHVLALPLSRDLECFNTLKRSLAIYRMVFGQPRQEDLLAFLTGRLPEVEIAQVASELRIDLSPPRSALIVSRAAE